MLLSSAAQSIGVKKLPAPHKPLRLGGASFGPVRWSTAPPCVPAVSKEEVAETEAEANPPKKGGRRKRTTTATAESFPDGIVEAAQVEDQVPAEAAPAATKGKTRRKARETKVDAQEEPADPDSVPPSAAPKRRGRRPKSSVSSLGEEVVNKGAEGEGSEATPIPAPAGRKGRSRKSSSVGSGKEALPLQAITEGDIGGGAEPGSQATAAMTPPPAGNKRRSVRKSVVAVPDEGTSFNVLLENQEEVTVTEEPHQQSRGPQSPVPTSRGEAEKPFQGVDPTSTGGQSSEATSGKGPVNVVPATTEVLEGTGQPSLPPIESEPPPRKRLTLKKGGQDKGDLLVPQGGAGSTRQGSSTSSVVPSPAPLTENTRGEAEEVPGPDSSHGDLDEDEDDNGFDPEKGGYLRPFKNRKGSFGPGIDDELDFDFDLDLEDFDDDPMDELLVNMDLDSDFPLPDDFPDFKRGARQSSPPRKRDTPWGASFGADRKAWTREGGGGAAGSGGAAREKRELEEDEGDMWGSSGRGRLEGGANRGGQGAQGPVQKGGSRFTLVKRQDRPSSSRSTVSSPAQDTPSSGRNTGGAPDRWAPRTGSGGQYSGGRSWGPLQQDDDFEEEDRFTGPGRGSQKGAYGRGPYRSPPLSSRLKSSKTRQDGDMDEAFLDDMDDDFEDEEEEEEEKSWSRTRGLGGPGRAGRTDSEASRWGPAGDRNRGGTFSRSVGPGRGGPPLARDDDQFVRNRYSSGSTPQGKDRPRGSTWQSPTPGSRDERYGRGVGGRRQGGYREDDDDDMLGLEEDDLEDDDNDMFDAFDDDNFDDDDDDLYTGRSDPVGGKFGTRPLASAAAPSSQAEGPSGVPADFDLGLSVRVSGLDRDSPVPRLTSALKQHFEVCGVVEHVHIPTGPDGKHHGWAYVGFAGDREKRLAMGLDGTRMMDQDLKVESAGQKKKKDKASEAFRGEIRGTDDTTLFVKGLDPSFSEAELREALKDVFSQHGRVVQIRLPTTPEGETKGIAFVVFGSAQAKMSAVKSMGSTEVLGRRIVIDPSPSSGKGRGGDAARGGPAGGRGLSGRGSSARGGRALVTRGNRRGSFDDDDDDDTDLDFTFDEFDAWERKKRDGPSSRGGEGGGTRFQARGGARGGRSIPAGRRGGRGRSW